MNTLRSRCCRASCWPAVFLAVALANQAVAATPVFTLKSRTLLKEGEVSPRENAVYVHPTGESSV